MLKWPPLSCRAACRRRRASRNQACQGLALSDFLHRTATLADDAPAHKVDATVHTHKGTSSHVPDHAVILDGEVAAAVLADGAPRRVHARALS